MIFPDRPDGKILCPDFRTSMSIFVRFSMFPDYVILNARPPHVFIIGLGLLAYRLGPQPGLLSPATISS